MTNTTDNSTVAARITACLTNLDIAGLIELCGPNTVLDMNVPQWRAQYRGPDAIRGYFDHELADVASKPRCTAARTVVAADTVVVESEFRFDGEDGEHLWRAVDWFDVANDKIERHTQYCTGIWSPNQIARHAREAPMLIA